MDVIIINTINYKNVNDLATHITYCSEYNNCQAVICSKKIVVKLIHELLKDKDGYVFTGTVVDNNNDDEIEYFITMAKSEDGYFVINAQILNINRKTIENTKSMLDILEPNITNIYVDGDVVSTIFELINPEKCTVVDFDE